MTMLGSGDYGQRTVSWLVKDIGLVKSELYIRWTEHPYDSDYTANNSYLDTPTKRGYLLIDWSSILLI